MFWHVLAYIFHKGYSYWSTAALPAAPVPPDGGGCVGGVRAGVGRQSAGPALGGGRGDGGHPALHRGREGGGTLRFPLQRPDSRGRQRA